MSLEIKKRMLTDEECGDIAGGNVAFNSARDGASDVYSTYSPDVVYHFKSANDMKMINGVKNKFYDKYGYSQQTDELILAKCLELGYCYK